MPLPDYEPRQVPEGHYKFQIKEEPEQRKHRGERGEFISVSFLFKLTDDNNDTYSLKESLLPWEDRYRSLALALNAPIDKKGKVHMSQIEEFTGKTFDADVIHVEDKQDATKTWARLANIVIPDEGSDEDVPPPSSDDVPF